MNLRGFLETFATVEDLKNILFAFDQPGTGLKAVLISRVLDAGGRSPVEILVRLSNDTLQNALRANNLSPGGRKSELVVRLIEAGVVSPSPDETLSFLESLDKEDLGSYCELLLSAGVAMQAHRVARLLARASEEHLHVFAKAFRSGGDAANATEALVSLLSKGSGDGPCFAACVLEDMMEAGGTASPVASAIGAACDGIMARQRRIRESFERFPHLAHPAVDALLQKCWSGDLAQSSVLKGMWEEVRSETRRVESAVQSLRDSTQAETLKDVSRRAARIDLKTEDIKRGVQTLHDQLVAVQIAVQKHVEQSPDEVARAMERLLKTKEVKWGTRRKIKRDLRRFWILTDRLQKVEFLGRAVVSYGPVVLSALRGLL